MCDGMSVSRGARKELFGYLVLPFFVEREGFPFVRMETLGCWNTLGLFLSYLPPQAAILSASNLVIF